LTSSILTVHCTRPPSLGLVRNPEVVALLAAARHGTVRLLELAAPHKRGRAKKYFVHDPLAWWEGFLDEGVDLPPRLSQCRGCPGKK
jgi:hypothetical protein